MLNNRFIQIDIRKTLGILFFIIFSINSTGYAVEKYHPLENYWVTYELSGIESGTKELVSLNYGNKECIVEKSETRAGPQVIKNNKKIIKVIEGNEQWVTTINLDDNTGSKIKNPLFKGMVGSIQGQNKENLNLALIKQMGGEKKEIKEINGETCTEWTTLSSGFACITDDQILIESGANMGGISILETAVKVRRNNKGPDNICDLGNAKITELDITTLKKK